jgi:membrane fusion protein, multidrug efflux system
VLKASLADRQIVQLGMGDEARVSFDALPRESLRAKVSRLPAAADPRTGMFDVELTLAEPDPRLKSGLVARLQLSPASATAGLLVHVPIGAILEGDRERASVYVHDAAAGRVSRRAVRVAFIDGDSVALASGLDVGAEVVVEGAYFVSEGAAVRVVESGAGGDE